MRSCYLNFAADLRAVSTDPLTERKLTEARRTQRRFSAKRDEVGWPYFRAGVANTRAEAALRLGIPSETLLLTEGAIAGLLVVLGPEVGLAGDRVLTTDAEYGATYVQLARHGQPAIVSVLDACEPAEIVSRFVDACVRHRPALVVASHVCFLDGRVLPVADIIAAVEERLGDHAPRWAIDGAQALGNVDVDVEALGADFYFGCFHKWVQGPAPTGFLHVRRETDRLCLAPGLPHVLAADDRYVRAADGRLQTECSRIGLQLPEMVAVGHHLQRQRQAGLRSAGTTTAVALRAAIQREEALAPCLLDPGPEMRSAMVALALPAVLATPTSLARLDHELRRSGGAPGQPLIATLHEPRPPSWTLASGIRQPVVLRLSPVDTWMDGSIPAVVARIRSSWLRTCREHAPG